MSQQHERLQQVIISRLKTERRFLQDRVVTLEDEVAQLKQLHLMSAVPALHSLNDAA